MLCPITWASKYSWRPTTCSLTSDDFNLHLVLIYQLPHACLHFTKLVLELAIGISRCRKSSPSEFNRYSLFFIELNVNQLQVQFLSYFTAILRDAQIFWLGVLHSSKARKRLTGLPYVKSQSIKILPCRACGIPTKIHASSTICLNNVRTWGLWAQNGTHMYS